MPFLYSNKQESHMPDTIQLEDGKSWKVQQPFVYIYNENGTYYEILIPQGFITDYGSIPQIFQNIIPKNDEMSGAYVVHDLIYASEMFSRSLCDDILLKAFQELGASWIKRNIVYSAVRAGGWNVWRNHDKKKINEIRDMITYQKRIMTSMGNNYGIYYNVFNESFQLI